MQFDIVIPHFGTGRLTELCRRCLEAIREHSADYRLIFVDNASPEFDAIRPELDRHPHLLIRNTRNLGFVKATNLGLWASVAPYVVLMNNDTEAVPGWLEKLRAPFERFPDVGLSGPLTTAKGSWQGNWKPTGKDIHILAPGRMLAFFCTMFKREVFEHPNVGVLDEAFGVGFGDDDFQCFKAERAGFKMALVENLTIPHHHRSTFKEVYGPDAIPQMQDAAMKLFRIKQAETSA